MRRPAHAFLVVHAAGAGRGTRVRWRAVSAACAADARCSGAGQARVGPLGGAGCGRVRSRSDVRALARAHALRPQCSCRRGINACKRRACVGLLAERRGQRLRMRVRAQKRQLQQRVIRRGARIVARGGGHHRGGGGGDGGTAAGSYFKLTACRKRRRSPRHTAACRRDWNTSVRSGRRNSTLLAASAWRSVNARPSMGGKSQVPASQRKAASSADTSARASASDAAARRSAKCASAVARAVSMNARAPMTAAPSFRGSSSSRNRVPHSATMSAASSAV